MASATLELQQPLVRRALLFLRQHRLAANEAAGLVVGADEAQAGFERRVLDADVVAPMAVALLGAAGIHGVEASELQAVRRTGFDNPLEDMQRELGRNVDLPTQLADIGDAVGAHDGVADLQLLRVAEREGLVAQVGARQRRHQGA